MIRIWSAPSSPSTPCMPRKAKHARYLVEDRQAHYLLSVKNNQPTLARQLTKLPWKQISVLDQSRDRGHGREEVREATVDAWPLDHREHRPLDE